MEQNQNNDESKRNPTEQSEGADQPLLGDVGGYYNNVKPVTIRAQMWSSVYGYSYNYCMQYHPDKSIRINSEECKLCKYFCGHIINDYNQISDNFIKCNSPYYTWNKGKYVANLD